MGAASMYTRARSSVDAGGFPCVRFIDCNGHEIEDPQLDNCHPIRCALSPELDAVPCGDNDAAAACCDETNETLGEILEKLCELAEQQNLVDTGCRVICGPQIGAFVFSDPATGGCLFFDSETKTFQELDLVANEMGKPAVITDPADIAGVTCYNETIFANVCNDDPAVPLVLVPDDIIALVTGETFNNEALDAVDLDVDGQILVGATVNSWPQNSTVKKADGDFIVTTAAACVVSANGDKYNLQSGGSQPLGDTSTTLPHAPVYVDESVEIPCGSAVRFCFHVRLCLTADGEPVVPKIVADAAVEGSTDGVAIKQKKLEG